MNSKPSKPLRGKPTEAVHVADGNDHFFSVSALRVLLCKDGESWFAQGLEIDYASYGATIDEAKSNFEEGLKLTVHEHLKMHGSVERLLTVAPQQVWREYFATRKSDDAIRQRFTAVQMHHLNSEESCESDFLPFDVIQYIGSECGPESPKKGGKQHAYA